MHVAGIATVCKSAEAYNKKSTTRGQKGSRWRKKIETPVPYKLKFVAISCCVAQNITALLHLHKHLVCYRLWMKVLYFFSSNKQTMEKRYACIYTFFHILDPSFVWYMDLETYGNITGQKLLSGIKAKEFKTWINKLWFYRSHEGGIYSRQSSFDQLVEEKNPFESKRVASKA
jgi:hypothetical protein